MIEKKTSWDPFKFIPGEKRFGIYRYLPIFFVSGAILEYAMIFWRPNGTNFYDTYKKKKAHELALERFSIWKDIEALSK